MLGMRVATAALRKRPRMEEMAEIARQRARESGHPVLVSVSTRVKTSDPLELFARAMGATHHRFFWSIPSKQIAIAGLGSAWSHDSHGSNPFPAAQAAWQELLATAAIDIEDEELPFAGPLAVSGFAFDPSAPRGESWADFPEGMLLLPRIVLARVGEHTSLTVNGLVGPDTSSVTLTLEAARRLIALIGEAAQGGNKANPMRLSDSLDGATWRSTVGDAVAMLKRGEMEKVVLARSVLVDAQAPLDLPAALERLRRDYPDTFVFAVARGGRTFFGASPERLVSLENGEISAFGLAGSIARGKTPAEDERLANELLTSSKDLHEHGVVVRTILEDLDEISSDLQAPEAPSILKVRNVQHLFTPITGRLAEGYTIFDLLARLHPTPAVGGRPREQALAWIREHEGLERGWYAGPVGWINAKGEGEFAVALRSALADRQQALLFAGCGIVSDSDPNREYNETKLKLRAILGALGEVEA
jgi:isochorismate synthase